VKDMLIKKQHKGMMRIIQANLLKKELSDWQKPDLIKMVKQEKKE
jgi:hypothetical protein